MFFDTEKTGVHERILKAVAESGGGEKALTAALTEIDRYYGNYRIFVWTVNDKGLVPIYPNPDERAYALLFDKVNEFYQDLNAKYSSSEGKRKLYVNVKLFDSEHKLMGILFIEHKEPLTIQAKIKEFNAGDLFAEIEATVKRVLQVTLPSCDVKYFADRANSLALPFLDKCGIDKDTVTGTCLVKPRDIQAAVETFGHEKVVDLIKKWLLEARKFFEDEEFVYGDSYGFLIVSKRDVYAFSNAVRDFCEIIKKCAIRDVIDRQTRVISAEPALVVNQIDESRNVFSMKFENTLIISDKCYHLFRRQGVLFVGDPVYDEAAGTEIVTEETPKEEKKAEEKAKEQPPMPAPEEKKDEEKMTTLIDLFESDN